MKGHKLADMLLPSVCFVIAYFGKWPVWMPLFLESCRRNTGFNWLIFGDGGRLRNLPCNVGFEPMTLVKFNSFAQRQTGLSFDITRPYKISDIRGMFGHIFARYIKNFQFWGHTDIDLVYGDLDSFGVRRELISCDIYSPYRTPVGHFTIFRNVEEVNSLYLDFDNLEGAYKGDQSVLGYDERQLAAVLRRSNKIRFKHVENYKAELSRKVCRVGATIMPFGQIIGERFSADERYLWKEGKTFQIKGERVREFMYLHFFMWKGARYWGRFDPKGKTPGEFWFDAGGFALSKNQLMPTNLPFKILRFSQFTISRFWNGLRWATIIAWRKYSPLS